MQLKMYRLLRKETWKNNVIKIVFFLSSFSIKFVCLLMANKYNYDQAYYDVYSTIISIYIVDYSIDDSIDANSADLAMSYLFKAAEKGHQQAKRKVEKVISSGVKDSKEQVKIAYHAF